MLYSNSYTIVELNIEKATSSEISLCHLNEEEEIPKVTRMILYREEEKSILKLIGQVKEKNKREIFFDCQLRKGKYFLFVEGEKKYSNAVLSYSGEEKAYMKIVENVENGTMKNKNNEYIPIKRESKVREKEREAPKYLQSIFDFQGGKDKFSERMSDNNSDKLEKIKNQFLDYLTN